MNKLIKRFTVVLIAAALLLQACAGSVNPDTARDAGASGHNPPPYESGGLPQENAAPNGGDSENAVPSPQSGGDPLFPDVSGREIGGIQNDYILEVTDRFIARLSLEGKTEAEKVLEAYRELIASTWFDDPIGLDIWRYRGEQSEPPPFLENRALSPLLFGIGSCEDYAAAMTLILRRMGFEAQYVPGLTVSVKRKYVDHAWTVVKLDGQWYHLDPQLEGNVMNADVIEYRYFLKPDEWMLADHLWGESWIEYGLAGDIPLTQEQIREIRSGFMPPACVSDFPPPPREKLHRLPPPDKVALIEELERERGRSGQPPVSDGTLNILPPVFYENATPASGEPPEREKPYSKSFLRGATLTLYNELERAAAEMRVDSLVELPAGVSAQEWEQTVSAFLDDNPLYYWAKPQPHTVSDGSVKGFVLSARPPLDARELERRQRELETAAQKILENVPRGDRFTQAAAIHDELIKHIRYDGAGDGADSGNIYGGLVEGRGICDAFAHSYQYLLQLRGIPCIYISGKTPWGAYHAWNAVKLEDGWYYVDTTWDRDERNGGVFHDYLFITYDEMAAEHIPGAGRYPPLPADNLTANNYYIRKGYSAAATKDSARAIAAAFLAALEDAPLGKAPESVFLEIRVEDDAEGFKVTREYFAKNTFVVLGAINELARERGSGARVVSEGRAEFNYSDSTRVLTLIPQAYREINGSIT